MNSILRSKLTSAKRSESTVFEFVFPDIEDIIISKESEELFQIIKVHDVVVQMRFVEDTAADRM